MGFTRYGITADIYMDIVSRSRSWRTFQSYARCEVCEAHDHSQNWPTKKMIVSIALRQTSPTALYLSHDIIGENWSKKLDVNGVASSLFTTLKHSAPQSLGQVQQMGENAFAAMFLIAFLQAMLALYQYRNNPKGSLLVPPGSTEGTASPDDKCDTFEKDPKSWINALRDLESSFKTIRQGGMSSIFPDEKGEPSTLTRKINKALILLVPWTSNVLSFLIQRNLHLFHLGFFLSLSQLLDVPERFFASESQKPSDADSKERHIVKRPIQRVIVLGDSLAAGVGTVEVFEEELGDIQLIQGPGPVFPRVLAQRISENSGLPVHWRSAGVVGGDVKDIAESCMDIIREEVENERHPDLVMIICGINDLKRFATNPFQNAGPKEFRDRIIKLVTEIKDLSPGTKVVLPSIPTQMFRRDSPLNIFPLVLFLNTVVGFWDSQKKIVAKKFPKGDVSYIGLDPNEVYEWYMSDPSKYGIPMDLDGDGIDDTTLISRDGVHPNARCYAFWGASLGSKLSPP